ncbi:MAG TPA: RodZ domain-containing protein, partial [Candidatus Eremiobacteraceae bacterium]|nr:RodZ domain-containing protein [Candidatus Eremiobacteraceae bacterium]
MSEKAMDYIGEQLSTARRRLGLTTTQVAERLRIRAMFVEALEREEWATIGEFVYVRGFLKNYATLLGLDAAAIVQQISNEYAPEVAAPRPSLEALAGSGLSSVRSEADAGTRRWFPWVLGSLTVIAGALVIMVGVSLVGMFSAANKRASDAMPTVQNTAGAIQPSLPEGSFVDTSADGQNQSGVNLRLQLTQPSWLSVTVDGKRVVYETLPAGTVRDFHGVREITLRAGNAGGVVAKIDG